MCAVSWTSDVALGGRRRVVVALCITWTFLHSPSAGFSELHGQRSAEFLSPASRVGFDRRDADDDLEGSLGAVRAGASDRARASAGADGAADEKGAARDRAGAGDRPLYDHQSGAGAG